MQRKYKVKIEICGKWKVSVKLEHFDWFDVGDDDGGQEQDKQSEEQYRQVEKQEEAPVERDGYEVNVVAGGIEAH